MQMILQHGHTLWKEHSVMCRFVLKLGNFPASLLYLVDIYFETLEEVQKKKKIASKSPFSFLWDSLIHSYIKQWTDCGSLWKFVFPQIKFRQGNLDGKSISPLIIVQNVSIFYMLLHVACTRRIFATSNFAINVQNSQKSAYNDYDIFTNG